MGRKFKLGIPTESAVSENNRPTQRYWEESERKETGKTSGVCTLKGKHSKLNYGKRKGGFARGFFSGGMRFEPNQTGGSFARIFFEPERSKVWELKQNTTRQTQSEPEETNALRATVFVWPDRIGKQKRSYIKKVGAFSSLAQSDEAKDSNNCWLGK